MLEQFKTGPSGKILFVGFVLLAGLLLVTTFLPALTFAHNDLRAYWGASYLLRHGESFADPKLMKAVQWELTNYDKSAMMTWNPPWLLVIFLPLSLLPFAQAVWLWLIFSAVLLGGGAWLICLRYERPRVTQHTAVGLLLAALFFAPWWVHVLIGQVSILIFFGLAGYLYFQEKAPFLAGLLLAVTTVKPHILFLLLPVALLHALWRRQWTLLAGFVTFLVGATFITFAFRPTFINEYMGNLAGNQSMLLSRPSPTLSNLLAIATGLDWLRFAGLALVPMVIGYWWFRARAQRGQAWFHTAAWLTLLSVMTMPYGYSFDFVSLFMPITLVVMWLVSEDIPLRHGRGLVLLFVIFNLLFMIQSKLPLGHYLLAWYPTSLALLFGWAYATRKKQLD